MADQQDPSKMSDEELEKALAEGGTPEPETKPEPKKEEPKKAEKPEPPKTEEPETTEEEEEEESEETEEPDKKPDPKKEEPSRREQLRVQQLLARLKESPDKKPEAPKAPDALDYESELDANPELIKKLQDDRDKSNQAMYNRGLEQANSIQFLTRLEIDEPRVLAKYKFMDRSDKENFDAQAFDTINSRYLQFVGWNPDTKVAQHPDIRYADFVEAEVEFAQTLGSHMTEDTRKNIAKQAANTGLRPDGSSAKRMNLNKAPENMSDEELDAIIAQAIPKL